MPNGMRGGVRGRKTKVGRKLLRFPPTRLSRTLHLKSEFQWEYKQEPFYNGHTCKSENISLPTLSLTEFMRKSNVNLMQSEYDSAYNSQISLRAVSIQVCTFAEKYIMLWL